MSAKIPDAAKQSQRESVENQAASAPDSERKSVIEEHKGKLAIGVAATLGIMILYKWRAKKLAEEDPEAYAQLQKLKELVKLDKAHVKHGRAGAAAKTRPTRNEKQRQG